MEILMPKMGLTMETGMVVRWHVKAGDGFVKGQALLDVESDKATNTVDARFDGVLTRIIVGEGQECAAGEAIAMVERKSC